MAKIIFTSHCENVCECDDCREFRAKRSEFYDYYIRKVWLQKNKNKKTDYELELLRSLRSYSFARAYCIKQIDKIGADFWLDSRHSAIYEHIKLIVADGKEPNWDMFLLYAEKQHTLNQMGGTDYLAELFGGNISSVDYEMIFQHLQSNAYSRKIKQKLKIKN